MKIATITCHNVYNYGASLQAYALQEFCKSLGCDYCIIDYNLGDLSRSFKLNSISNSFYDKPIVRQLYLAAKLPSRLIALKRKRAFDRFRKQYLQITDNYYMCSADLEDNLPDCNLFIAGSDQIWNVHLRNGLDRGFYLDFVKERGRKISYAASFAIDTIPEYAISFVKQQLENFDAISVREQSALGILDSLGFNNATLVADPVFLVSKEKWISLISDIKPPKKEYILIYDFEHSESLKQIALTLKRRTGLPIYSISPFEDSYADKNVTNIGPLQFLCYMANAQHVVANSFHALTFSIIFEKDFYIVNRSENYNSRMRDMLRLVGEEDRLIYAGSQICETKLEFNNIKQRLKPLIEESKAYLKTQIDLAQ